MKYEKILNISLAFGCASLSYNNGCYYHPRRFLPCLVSFSISARSAAFFVMHRRLLFFVSFFLATKRSISKVI